MAKVTRSVLKEMVKECLVEILSEGLVNSSDQLHESKKRKPRQRKAERVDASVFQERKKMLRKNISVQENAVKNRVNNITQDPIMQDILADTAATTFKEQPLTESAAKRDYVPGDAAAKAVYDNELEDLFDGAENWASLAFSGGKN